MHIVRNVFMKNCKIDCTQCEIICKIYGHLQLFLHTVQNKAFFCMSIVYCTYIAPFCILPLRAKGDIICAVFHEMLYIFNGLSTLQKCDYRLLIYRQIKKNRAQRIKILNNIGRKFYAHQIICFFYSF